MIGDSFSIETCRKCGVCLDVCLCVKMDRPSICSYVARGEAGGAWICANCWRCEDDCPHGVDLYAVMMRQRRMESPPRAVLEAIANITTRGCAFRIQDLDDVRKTHGLSPVKMIDRENLAYLLGKK
jgi:Fe-S oxidoreductase